MVFQGMPFIFLGSVGLDTLQIYLYRLRTQAAFKSKQLVDDKELAKPRELNLVTNGSDSRPR